MLLLNTSTLCICDFIMRVYSTLVMLCFYGKHKVEVIIFIFNKNMLQLLPVALPLELGVFHIVSP